MEAFDSSIFPRQRASSRSRHHPKGRPNHGSGSDGDGQTGRCVPGRLRPHRSGHGALLEQNAGGGMTPPDSPADSPGGITAQQIADVLIKGERERKEVPQFSDSYPDVDVATAYRAQKAFVQSKYDAGETLVGYKLGLTSRNKQRAMGVDSPLYGRVTTSMLSTYGDPIPFDRFIHPRVESEIAFLLARDVEAPATVTSVLAAADVVSGAVDVLDSRYQGFI